MHDETKPRMTTSSRWSGFPSISWNTNPRMPPQTPSSASYDLGGSGKPQALFGNSAGSAAARVRVLAISAPIAVMT